MNLVSFEYITELLPIEGADRIELARVQGWQSVIKKGDFKVGDRVIFVPIDTVMQPAEWNKFLWDKNDPTKPIRIKTVRLKGSVSQGIIFPMTIINRTASIWNETFGDLSKEEYSYEDLARGLGITKYEKPIPAQLAGEVKGDFPGQFVSKTDEDNLLSNIAAFEELKKCDQVHITLKMDGTSATYIKEEDGSFRVCSRNLELRDTEKNVHWQMARKYDLQNIMKPGTALQGEICGPGIQKNPAGLKEAELFLFNYKNLKTGKYVPLDRNNLYEFELQCLQVVPFISRLHQGAIQYETVDSLQSWANVLLYENGEPAEGIVLRGLNYNGEYVFSPTLCKMLSVKIINQNYKD
jgi:RNA ligase (TIGR02306 family)